MQPSHSHTDNQFDTASIVLFLDFDGVAHPDPCFQDNALCRLPLIESVLREFACIEIVISSAWRKHYSLDELRDKFAPEMRPRVVDITPNVEKLLATLLPGSGPVHEREWEIETWLTANRPAGTPWIAIDDRPGEFTTNNPNLLVTDGKYGFRPAQQQTLRFMIKQREYEI